MPIFIQKIIFSLLATIWTVGFGLISMNSEPTNENQTTTTIENVIEVTTTTVAKSEPVDWALVELYVQMQDKRTPSIAYWDSVAKCETNSNWQDNGRFGGGLGIMNRGEFRDDNMGTWERWGGEQFAPTPDRATKIEQIVVANRIAIFGWQTKVERSKADAERMGVPLTYIWERPGIGYMGWGCIKNQIGPPPKHRK